VQALTDPEHDLLQLWAESGIHSLLSSFSRHVDMASSSRLSMLSTWLADECHPALIEERTLGRFKQVPFARLSPGLQGQFRAWCQSLLAFSSAPEFEQASHDAPLLARLQGLLTRMRV